MENKKHEMDFEEKRIEIVESTYDNSSVKINIDSSKLKNYFNEHLKRIKKRHEWTTPFGIFLVIITTLITTSFKENIFSPDTWKAIFVVLGLFSFAWLLKCLIAIASKPIDENTMIIDILNIDMDNKILKCKCGRYTSFNDNKGKEVNPICTTCADKIVKSYIIGKWAK